MAFLLSPSFWFSVLAGTTPVMLATLAASIVSQAGIFNLAIEGTMLICALAGVLASVYTDSLIMGAIIGVIFGIAVSYLLGYFTLVMKGPMNACGVAINLMATGGTVFVLVLTAGSKITSSALVSKTFPNIQIPGLSSIPFIGEVLSGHNFITYLGWVFVIACWFILYKTKLGLNIRAVGENEAAAQSAGINVLRTKFISLTFCGVFCAFGGMYLSMGSLKSFTAGMVAGRGYLSLAMRAISRANPILGFLSSLLYGFSETITVYLQLYSDLDLKLIEAFPYIFILVVLTILQMTKTKKEEKRAKAA